MVNLLTVSLTTACNYSCPACPMAVCRNKVDPIWHITNERLVPFLYKWVDPRQWLIELTGGEPGCYEGLPYLLEWLETHGYYGLVKTNGSLPIPQTSSFSRVAAWHQYEKMPKYFDQILIIHTFDRELDKVAYCKKNKIPYSIIGPGEDSSYDCKPAPIGLYGFVDAAGSTRLCPHKKQDPGKAASAHFGDSTSIDFSGIAAAKPCKMCKVTMDAWRFMPLVLGQAARDGRPFIPESGEDAGLADLVLANYKAKLKS